MKNRIEVVQPEEYTDYSDKFATKKTVALALLPVGIATTFIIKGMTNKPTMIPAAVQTPELIPLPLQTPTVPASMMSNIQPINPTVPAEAGFIADKSLEVLANVLDPLLQIMVAISFPIASVIMVGSCFHFMFGNNEKAWDSIMKAGLGYVLIQLSPLFLKILRQVGESVAA